MTESDIMQMSLDQLKKVEEQIWKTPKAEHGQAQIPYLYSKDINMILNACVKRREQLAVGRRGVEKLS
jgi:hypothetical protein